jgi:hypothetical protein
LLDNHFPLFSFSSAPICVICGHLGFFLFASFVPFCGY